VCSAAAASALQMLQFGFDSLLLFIYANFGGVGEKKKETFATLASVFFFIFNCQA
jgi:hypothetical protein